ncbi:hypothetical protein [Flexivirga sp. B27]
MTDPYRIAPSPGDDTYASFHPPADGTGRPGDGAGGVTSTMLWILTAVFAGLNTALSVAGQEIVGSVFGGLAAACLVVLLVRYLRRRDR